MRSGPPDEHAGDKTALGEKIGAKASRKIRARRHSFSAVWFGLGMMGVIGWSVALPTLIGAAIGMWLDQHHPSGHRWTLALLMAGLAAGCGLAGHWIIKENREIRAEQEGHDE